MIVSPCFCCSYPSSGGSPPVAVCISRASDYQLSYLVYDVPRGADDGALTCGGLPKSVLIASCDPSGVGYVCESPTPVWLPVGL